MRISPGYPSPLGTSLCTAGRNFALFATHAESVSLCLFKKNDESPFSEITMERTQDIWHVCIEGLEPEGEYAFRLTGTQPTYRPSLYMLDPYATRLCSQKKWGELDTLKLPYAPKARWEEEKPFDWESDQSPQIPPQDLLIYEMHVRAFTETLRGGTFKAMIEKIPHLKELGINAVELMPIFEFNECEFRLKHPHIERQLYNFWGYSTVNFFTPMNRYGSADDFKELVKQLHKVGIEVILDVVYNHTSEGGLDEMTICFRGIDNQIYYMVDSEGKYRDYTGCGNTLNANHPVVISLILDSLRYWVEEMHVDGFRFDLASALTRASNGQPMEAPPLIGAISNDPVLARTKLIAEAWDAAGLYQVGDFPCRSRWMEWNGKYRDSVRKFLKGTDGQAGDFARSLMGSEYLYGQERSPWHSVNFVVAHDGYTLRDLVSYQDKHNEANEEGNRDGANDNESWNCGVEGETNDPKILALRSRQMRNFHTALMVSLGTPMLFMGDEYGHTRHGNNNPWCQDNQLNWFLWDKLKNDPGYYRFYRFMIEFRKKCGLLNHSTFLTSEEVEWHGSTPLDPNWEPYSRFVAYTIKGEKTRLYLAFNAHYEDIEIELPPTAIHERWYRIVDTSLESPNDCIDNPQQYPAMGTTYQMMNYSTLILQTFLTD